jgi:cytochrome o ubiquinol oxidase subunit II
MFGVFDPQGPVALQERNIIVFAVVLMLFVAIPLIITLYTFAWKYRAGNKNAKHEPERVGHVRGQLIFWAILAFFIVIISTLNWFSTHALDPAKPLASNAKPITIQVVALEWKWLFIYPEQQIATVNYIQFPAGTPVHFELTADGPMSSFWIPELGSQIYAMAAMQTQINLMASTTGEFVGKNTEINGAGFAGMTFMAKASSQADFDAWVASVKASSKYLSVDEYNVLAAPSQDSPATFYSGVDQALYGEILNKYMIPSTSSVEAPGVPPDAQQVMPANMPGMQMMQGSQTAPQPAASAKPADPARPIMQM